MRVTVWQDTVNQYHTPWYEIIRDANCGGGRADATTHLGGYVHAKDALLVPVPWVTFV